MIMDFLRSHNITPTRMVLDSGEEFWVRWYPSAKGALPYPNEHAFGHPAWEPERNDFEGVGCKYRGLQWRPKRYPAPPGQHFRGLPQWFLDGLPAELLSVEPDGDACGVPAIYPVGGVVLNGSSWGWDEASLVVASGVSTTATDLSPTVHSETCGCGTPTTATSLSPTIISDPCGCGQPSSRVYSGVFAISETCGCGTPTTATSLSPTVHSETCGCGTPTTATSLSPTVHSETCGCGLPSSEVSATPWPTAEACGCGQPSSTVLYGPTVISETCGCGQPSSTVLYGPTVISETCGCGQPSSTVQPGPTVTSETCGCGEPSSTVQYGPTETSHTCGCGKPHSTQNTSGPITKACTNCPGGAPQQWKLVASGFPAGTCANLNGTWLLNWTSGCTWQSARSAGNYWWQLAGGSVNWQLDGVGPSFNLCSYRLVVGSWACLGSNTLASVPANNNCGAATPATVTVTPV